jgi:hypothetical protein
MLNDTDTEICTQTETHQSRWGYHPCSYEDFMLLRALYRRFVEARRNYHRWVRWDRKQPQNRVRRKSRYDALGRRCGRDVIGPMPEPPLDPLFIICEVGIPSLKFQDVEESYRIARHPAPSPEDVLPMPTTRLEIVLLGSRVTVLKVA